MLNEHWLYAFCWTQMIELSCGVLWYCLIKNPSSLPFKKVCLAILIASTLTHPILWFALTPLCLQLGLNQMGYWIVSESYVILIEAYWYKKCRFTSYLLFSFALNLLSYFAFFIVV